MASTETFKWKVPLVKKPVQVALALLLTTLLVVNFLLVFISSVLLDSYPKTFQLQEIFLRLNRISVLFLSFFPLFLTNWESEIQRKVSFVTNLIFLPLSYSYVIYASALIPVTRVFWEVKNLENLDDPNVDLLKTFYLGVYHECCFEPNELPPALDCESRNNTEPCYLNEDLFQEIISGPDFSFESPKCVGFGGLHLSDINKYGIPVPTRGECPRGEEGFVKALAESTFKLLISTEVLSLLFGSVFLSISSHFILWLLGWN